jgi:DNA-packaging protein gp3
MGAPKGNQFWKIRSRHGRKKLFESPELLWDAAVEYFEWVDENPLKEQIVNHHQGKFIKTDVDKKRPYTWEGLTLYLDCSVSYFRNFKRDLANSADSTQKKDFITVIGRISQNIYNQKFEGAASGFFNANIIARDLGLKDKSEIEHAGEIGEYRLTKQERKDRIAELAKKIKEDD